MNEDLINRITYYLSSGGLFNPELADHLAVRNLLMECREALAQRTWVGLTDEEVKQLCLAVGTEPIEVRLIEAKLRSKNT
jgi:hypothetical protein